MRPDVDPFFVVTKSDLTKHNPYRLAIDGSARRVLSINAPRFYPA